MKQPKMKLYQPVLFVGLGGTGCRIGAEVERRQLAKFSESKIIHRRFDLLAGVHDEGSVSCDRFGNRNSAQDEDGTVGLGGHADLATAAFQEHELGILRFPRSVCGDGAAQYR